MKIHVVGQADRENGFFFSGIDGNFNYKKVEAIRWFNNNELAPCYFVVKTWYRTYGLAPWLRGTL